VRANESSALFDGRHAFFEHRGKELPAMTPIIEDFQFGVHAVRIQRATASIAA
jgi:hypothetical protein